MTHEHSIAFEHHCSNVVLAASEPMIGICTQPFLEAHFKNICDMNPGTPTTKLSIFADMPYVVVPFANTMFIILPERVMATCDVTLVDEL